MAQPSFLVDSLSIEPKQTDTRTISRDSSDGSLKFTDPWFPTGVLLYQLAGLQSITGVTTVGKGGGCVYQTIQEAIAAAPSGSSATNPYLILIMPGVYEELLTIQQDGVILMGFGNATITNPSNSDTITISASESLIPLTTQIHNLVVCNSSDGKACVAMTGDASSQVGIGEIWLSGCLLRATGVGSLQVKADTVNNVRVSGGSWAGSSSTSVSTIVQVAKFTMTGVEWVNDLEMTYDASSAVPAISSSEYVASGLPRVGDLVLRLVDLGSVNLTNVVMGSCSVGGTSDVAVFYSRMGDVYVEGTASVSLSQCIRGVVSSGEGSPTLVETCASGSVDFDNTIEATVSFSVPQTDNSYRVLLDIPTPAITAGVTERTANGFTITTSILCVGTINYLVLRDL